MTHITKPITSKKYFSNKGRLYVCLQPLRTPKRADARRNPQARLVALSRIAPRRKCPWGATRQMHAWGHALLGLQTNSGSALSLLNRLRALGVQPACLRNDASPKAPTVGDPEFVCKPEAASTHRGALKSIATANY